MFDVKQKKVSAAAVLKALAQLAGRPNAVGVSLNRSNINPEGEVVLTTVEPEKVQTQEPPKKPANS